MTSEVTLLFIFLFYIFFLSYQNYIYEIMNAKTMKTQNIPKMEYNLKGHGRSQMALLVIFT